MSPRTILRLLGAGCLPYSFDANAVAERIHLLMDVYDLAKERALPGRAGRYADRGVAGLRRGGLFARRVTDPFYESNDGVGNFVAGLLRVHLARNGGPGGGREDRLELLADRRIVRRRKSVK